MDTFLFFADAFSSPSAPAPHHTTHPSGSGGSAVLPTPESSHWGAQGLPEGKIDTHFGGLDFPICGFSQSRAARECTRAGAVGLPRLTHSPSEPLLPDGGRGPAHSRPPSRSTAHSTGVELRTEGTRPR